MKTETLNKLKKELLTIMACRTAQIIEESFSLSEQEKEELLTANISFNDLDITAKVWETIA